MISIIIPFYNTGEKIKNMVDSVKNQTFKDYEVILINDGSTDNTEDFLKTIIDDRFKIIKTDNQGISRARFHGLNFVSGQYVMFLDSDDFLDNNCLEYMLDVALKENADIVGANLHFYYENRYELIKFNKEGTFSPMQYIKTSSGTFRICNKLFKTKILKCITKPVLYISHAEDYFTAIQAILVSQKIVHIDKAFYRYYYEKKRYKLRDVLSFCYVFRDLRQIIKKDIFNLNSQDLDFLDSTFYKEYVNFAYKIIFSNCDLIGHELMDFINTIRPDLIDFICEPKFNLISKSKKNELQRLIESGFSMKFINYKRLIRGVFFKKIVKKIWSQH